mmetsp:Transcript_62605/g.116456  ORF Transcript_62605/g.116456 Transcript_62605/m.116456 type:complete len:140 (+) Transcript_62605:78-497(+)
MSEGSDAVSPLQVAKNYVQSPTTILLVISAGMALYGEGISVMGAAVAGFVIVGLGLGSFLVAKIENSEWRKELRRKVAEKERAMGITHKDKVTTAWYMGHSTAPVQAEGDEEPEGEASGESKEEKESSAPKGAEEKKDD